MEYKIGEQFNFKGKKYILKEDKSQSCENCCFYKMQESGIRLCNLSLEDKKIIGNCLEHNREDKKDIIYKEIQVTVGQEDFRAYKLIKVSDNIYKVYLDCNKNKRELHYNRCLFENMFKIVKKKYALFVINEVKTGGVLYCLSKDADTIFGKFRAYNKDKAIIPVYQKEIFGIKQISFKITNQPSKIKCGWFI